MNIFSLSSSEDSKQYQWKWKNSQNSMSYIYRMLWSGIFCMFLNFEFETYVLWKMKTFNQIDSKIKIFYYITTLPVHHMYKYNIQFIEKNCSVDLKMPHCSSCKMCFVTLRCHVKMRYQLSFVYNKIIIFSHYHIDVRDNF